MSYSWYRTGTCSCTMGSDTIRFQNANLTTAGNRPVVGDAFTLDMNILYEIIFIGSDAGGEYIRVERPFAQASVSNSKYAMARLASSTISAKIAAVASAAINQKQISLDDMYLWYTSQGSTMDFTGPDGVPVTVTTYYNLSNAMSTVGGSIASVETVASNISSVNTVSGNIAEVAAVGSDMPAISAVNANATNINTVATNVNSVSAVGTNIGEVIAVGANVPAIITVNSNIDDIIAVNSNMPAINNVNAQVDHIDQQVIHVDSQATIVNQQTVIATNKASESSASAAAALVSENNSKASENAAKLSETNSHSSELAAELAESNAKASETASSASQLAADASATLTAADRVQTGLDVVEANNATTKAKAWADNAIDVPVETDKYSARHWANVAKTNADETFVSGKTFTPTTGNQYPTPENPSRDTIFIIAFENATDNFIFTEGDCIGKTAFNTDQLFWNATGGFFKLVPSPTGSAILQANGKTGSIITIRSEDVPHESTTVNAALAGKVNTTDVATLMTSGITQLSNSFVGTLESKAVTEKALSSGLATKAELVHQHAGEDITSGTVAVARLPDASTTEKGATTLSNSINGSSEALAITEKALSDAISEPSGITFVYSGGDLTQMTEVLPRGNRVTDFTYSGGNLTQAVEVYNGVTYTTTYTYDGDGTLTEVIRA